MAPVSEAEKVDQWFKRIEAAKKLRESWEKDYEVATCYQYFLGNQRDKKTDDFGDRRIISNKIHSDVRQTIPSLYYYRPFARVVAAPEKATDVGSTSGEKAQLLQDTGNAIVRDPDTQFRDQTFLALKESFWALGCVEVGHSASFEDAPNAERPALKEEEDTKVDAAPADPLAGLPKVKSERFYVKHIPAKQLLMSTSDMAITEANDWVGYWEDYNLSDVKDASAYKNTSDLEANVGSGDKDSESAENKTDKIRLYKIWDLRSKTRYVFAEGHKKKLLKEKYSRLPLKFLRFDVDPYRFYPIPPLFNQIGEQDEINDSREYLRLIRKGTVPRYTYDEDAVTRANMEKLERGGMGTYVPRKSNSQDPIRPINQPSFAENAIKTLTAAEKGFSEQGGEQGNPQIAQGKTATQAVIANTKGQITDSFDRSTVADWLASIIEELIMLGVDEMLLDKWIIMNVDPDSMYAPMEAQRVQQNYQWITAEALQEAQVGIRWHVVVDVETLSPASEQQHAQQWNGMLQMLQVPGIARLLALSPELLKKTLDLNGVKSQRDQDLIGKALQKEAAMQMQMAAMAAKPLPQLGVSGQAAPAPSGPTGPVTPQGAANNPLGGA